MTPRICPSCETSVPLDSFGASFYCKPCMAERARARRAANPEKTKELARKHASAIPKAIRSKRNSAWRQANLEYCRARRRALYVANREAELEKSRIYKAANPERMAGYMKKRLRENPEYNRAAVNLRRARKMRAVPKWFDKEKVMAVYQAASVITATTGIMHHVDHIVPIQSDRVCGLHWHGNLQILTAHENQTKSNRHWPHGLAEQRA